MISFLRETSRSPERQHALFPWTDQRPRQARHLVTSISPKPNCSEDVIVANPAGDGYDPSLATALQKAAGYAVFPSVGKGAVGVGGAYGKGVLYQNGVPVGYCDLTQASIGIALGGQTFTQIIAFENPDALNRFKSGQFAFDAKATAVALKSGAAANAKFENGVAVFIMSETGLMAEASVGGQKFSYQPM